MQMYVIQDFRLLKIFKVNKCTCRKSNIGIGLQFSSSFSVCPVDFLNHRRLITISFNIIGVGRGGGGGGGAGGVAPPPII